MKITERRIKIEAGSMTALLITFAVLSVFGANPAALIIASNAVAGFSRGWLQGKLKD
ncbi:MAG: hypothetical protein ACRC62_34920 [Microcoleus sp.]